jgi:uncharacterized protein involved in type VI secretion and phage assembly
LEEKSTDSSAIAVPKRLRRPAPRPRTEPGHAATVVAVSWASVETDHVHDVADHVHGQRLEHLTRYVVQVRLVAQRKEQFGQPARSTG